MTRIVRSLKNYDWSHARRKSTKIAIVEFKSVIMMNDEWWYIRTYKDHHIEHNTQLSI